MMRTLEVSLIIIRITTMIAISLRCLLLNLNIINEDSICWKLKHFRLMNFIKRFQIIIELKRIRERWQRSFKRLIKYTIKSSTRRLLYLNCLSWLKKITKVYNIKRIRVNDVRWRDVRLLIYLIKFYVVRQERSKLRRKEKTNLYNKIKRKRTVKAFSFFYKQFDLKKIKSLLLWLLFWFNNSNSKISKRTMWSILITFFFYTIATAMFKF